MIGLKRCHVNLFIVYCLMKMQWGGEDSIWATRTTPIRNQEGVDEQMERNGVVQEMPLSIKSIAKGIWTEDAIVQESLWKANRARLSPLVEPQIQLLLMLLLPLLPQVVRRSKSMSQLLLLRLLLFPVATTLPTLFPLRIRNILRIWTVLLDKITHLPLPTPSTGLDNYWFLVFWRDRLLVNSWCHYVCNWVCIDHSCLSFSAMF